MQQEPYYDDEIDLRELVTTLLSGWKTILLITFVTGFMAFALSKWVLPEKYEATAYITISEPTVQFAESEQGVTIHSTLPDMTSVTELATNLALLEEVTMTSEVTPLWDAENDSLEGMVEASSIGSDQLRLVVSDTTPERAVLLANIWAREVALQINKLYGVDAIVDDIAQQVGQAQENYAQAQSLLEEELAQNRRVLIQAQLNSVTGNLDCILYRDSAATRILEDLETLESNLKKQEIDTTLSLGDALSLTTLQQRVSASQICASSIESIQLQVVDDTLGNFAVTDALKKISQMRESLQAQQPALATELTRLETEIPSLERELAAAEYRLAQEIEARNQAEELYTALLQHQNRISSLVMASDRVAKLSSQAIIPDEPSSPKTLLNTALGLVAGGMLGVFWVFAAGWWKNSAEEASK